jgi:hypothetical protein
VLLIGVGCGTSDLEWTFDTVGGLANYIQLIDRVKACWGLEFHNAVTRNLLLMQAL